MFDWNGSCRNTLIYLRRRREPRLLSGACAMEPDSLSQRCSSYEQDVASEAQLQLSLEEVAVKLMGRSSLDAVLSAMRLAMLRAALSQTAGNLTKTADLLGVRRQAVQFMVIRYELRQWAASLRGATRIFSVE